MKQILVFVMILFLTPAAAPLYLLGLVAIAIIRRAMEPRRWEPTPAQEAEYLRDIAAHEERVVRQGPTIPLPHDFYAQLEAAK